MSERGERIAERRQIEARKKRIRRARRKRRNRKILLVLLIFVMIAAAGIFFVWKKYGPSKERADLKEYYGIENEEELAVVIDNEIITDDEGRPGGKIIDGQAYLEFSIVQQYLNKRFYWDPNESTLLYTLPNGTVSVAVGSNTYTDITETKSENYVILKTEGRTPYIALPFIQRYTNIEFVLEKEPNRAAITAAWGNVQAATVKKDTEVRRLGGVKSPILKEVKKSDRVVVLEDEDDWKKVATADGIIGYIKTNALKDIKEETISREFTEPVYSNILQNHKINMAWHNIENTEANSYALQTMAGTKGLTTIAPTWFSIADTDGNLNSLADPSYVNYAHQMNLEVWAVLRDFHGGISSYDETYQVLSYTSKRMSLINQVIGEALQTGIDGINLDFELVSAECGQHYVQFVRELSVKCRQNGLVFSIDDYVPQPYNEFYDLEEQGIVADYVIIMGYDEHTEGSYEAGSVASYGYLEQGITNALQSVPKEKLIAGVPFYTRLWFETPKTQEELAAQQGTEEADYPNKITSTALGMDEAQQMLQMAQVEAQWDETTKQNYAEWEADGGTYKIWLEDPASLEEKLKLIKTNDLAGVAAWKIGFESSGIWDLVLQYVN